MPDNKQKLAAAAEEGRCRGARRAAAQDERSNARPRPAAASAPSRQRPERPRDIVSRLLAALEFIAQAKEPVTAADLATGLGIPRATAYRIFTRLEQEQIVIPEPGGRGFAAGERFPISPWRC